MKTKMFLTAILAVTLAGSAGATVINLTTTAVTSGELNGGIFVQGSVQSSGTGTFNVFLKYQPGGNSEAIQGYNSDLRNQGSPKTEYDEQSSPTHNHSLLLSEVPSVPCDAVLIPGCVAGTNYRQFDLDINQTNPDPLVSLDRVVIYQRASGDLFGGGATDGAPLGGTALFGDGTLVYDSGADNRVDLNWAIVKGGSGKSDMYLYVPDSLFSGTDDFVYLYSEFGLFSGTEVPCEPGPDPCGGPQADASGFEEWGVRDFVAPPPPRIPEPASIVLFGSSVLAIALWGKKRFAR